MKPSNSQRRGRTIEPRLSTQVRDTRRALATGWLERSACRYRGKLKRALDFARGVELAVLGGFPAPTWARRAARQMTPADRSGMRERFRDWAWCDKARVQGVVRLVALEALA